MVTHSMENILNMQYYSPVSDEAVHSPPSRKKRCLTEKQDPMSHRIIEKRRRDRMNNCLADLSRLIPAEYLKKGRGRVEKTEIIEMAIRHMKYLQGLRQDTKQQHAPVSSVQHHAEDSVDSINHPSPPSSSSSSSSASASEHYRLGFQECLSEMMHFLVEVEGFFAHDALVVQLISHLQQHCNKILASSDRLGFPHPVDLATNNNNNNASSCHANGNAPSMCSNGTSIGNGLGLFSGGGNSNNSNNNNSNSHNLNGNGHQQSSLIHSGSNSNSDRCSSSGVSSYDPCESKPCQRPFIPPPNLTSDDSNHSSHSHGSSAGGFPASGFSGLSHHHHHEHQHHHDHHHDHHDSHSHEQHHSADQQRQQPSTYKFKNSIKQRFSADQRINSSCSPPPCQTAARHESPTRDDQPSQNQNQNQQHHQGVPIFALHDNGGFYIPLTVEASVLRPQLGCASSHADVGPETVLHPVTISVNFNHSSTQHQQHQHQQPATPWSHSSSPPHQQAQ